MPDEAATPEETPETEQPKAKAEKAPRCGHPLPNDKTCQRRAGHTRGHDGRPTGRKGAK